MGVQVGFHGGSSRFASRQAWLWPLNHSGPAAALDGRQRFCTSESMRPVRLLEINISAVAYGAMWGYGVGLGHSISPSAAEFGHAGVSPDPGPPAGAGAFTCLF